MAGASSGPAPTAPALPCAEGSELDTEGSPHAQPLPGYPREPRGAPLRSPWPGSSEPRAFPSPGHSLGSSQLHRSSARGRCGLGSLLHSAAGGTCRAGAAGASPGMRRFLRASPASREGISPSRPPSRTPGSGDAAADAAPAGAGVSSALLHPLRVPAARCGQGRASPHPLLRAQAEFSSLEGETEAREKGRWGKASLGAPAGASKMGLKAQEASAFPCVQGTSGNGGF